jgi:hypothetical protein
MQAAHSSSNWVALTPEPPPAELPLAVELPLLGAELPLPGAELPLLVAPRLATPGTLDPLLHAASPIAAATTRTASPGRRHLAVLSRLPGPFVAGR